MVLNLYDKHKQSRGSVFNLVMNKSEISGPKEFKSEIASLTAAGQNDRRASLYLQVKYTFHNRTFTISRPQNTDWPIRHVSRKVAQIREQ